MNISEFSSIGSSYIKRYALLLIIVWSIMVFALLSWATIRTDEETVEYAHIYSNVAFEKDLLFRHWATLHGEVYVPITNKTQPSPYLSEIPERDITTPSGKQLTLMNPAYISHQLYDLEKESSEARSHLTSLTPIKPENAPDKWEKNALIAFERGETEVFSIETIEGREYFRQMQPLFTEKGCLKCHPNQESKASNISGGISVSMPMDSIRELAGLSQSRNILIYVLIWLVGTSGLVFGYIQVNKTESKRNHAEMKLKKAYVDLENQTVQLGHINEKLQTEISEHKRLKEVLQKSEEKFRTVADFAYEWEYWVDPQLQIVYISPSAERISGYRPEEFIADPGLLYRIVHPDDKELYQQHISRHFEKTVYDNVEDIEFRIIARNGEVRWINHVCSMIYNMDRQYIGMRASNRDITQRKLVEEELYRHRENLEELVRERTTALEIARDRALESDRLKSAFLATMSHELRTPLNSIIGFTGIILEGLSGPINEEQKKQLKMVKNSSMHLLSIIQDILDVSKIESGQLKLNITRFRMHKSIEVIIQLVKPLANVKELALLMDVEEEEITSDQRRVEQILFNLLSNAIKFTEKGEVKVECHVSNGQVITRVIDTGIGIKPENMDRLFKPFQQLDDGLSRRYEGTGLGLSISKKLVEMLGGEIRAESEYGKGTVFTFTLPLNWEVS